ncbi:hypothetical protein CTEN210_00990 [Chaetoceros tenuissimus]|uniref:Peptidase M11 gametolysin domain-containing protein n=1 Tax=Chaetoceros tenuissimus TaxID=426638 RepID=A0AAD3CEU6_9STRA|nr:hypothetical protein CTEN210_00990 [Chaetoceros tenuissimus]
MYSKQVLSALLLASSAVFTSAASLRSNRRRLADNSECTILVAEYLEIPGAPSQEPTIDCEFDDGMIYNIQGTAYQKEVLKQKWAAGEIASGATSLGLGVGAFRDENGLFIPPGHDIASNVRQNPQRRKLAIVEGTKPILAVRVTDASNPVKVHPDNAALMSDNIFGTNGDPVNLKSQLSACSHGKLNVIPAPDANLGSAKAAAGTIEVTINVSLEGNSRATIRNAVTQAVQAKLGYSLPGPFQQVMYMLQGCYVDCGWAAYAYINSWNSVYQGNYYFMTGVQVHELGHNFNLAHSGGLNGATYTDHTDDAKILINPVVEPSTTVNLVGIADYDIRAGRPVVVKLETGAANDYFIGFNRATRANSQNDEADNEVTIVQVDTNNGEGYSQSYLKAHLIQGESYTIANFANSGSNLVITADTINLGTNPGQATVSIVLQTGPTAAPTSAPTSSPTASPTSSPTNSPTPAPTEPTPSPTTAAPTKSPTPAPTQNCTTLGKTQCQSLTYCAWSGRFKSCSFNTSSPVSSPVAEPTTGGPGPGECVATGQPCPTDGNTCCFGCQLKGKKAGLCK